MKIALIDADSLLYKAGFSFEEKTCWNELEIQLGIEQEPQTTISSDLLLSKNAIDATIENIKFKTGCDEVELWITGNSNFRYEVMPTYKGNRVGCRKPIDYNELYKYLVNNYKANIADNVEADDMVVYLKTEYSDNYVLCAIDKDVLYQTVGTHYNYNKDEFVEVTPREAERFFWFQVLTGDTVDGYKGCIGIGKAKATKLLDQIEEECRATNSNFSRCYQREVLRIYLENGQSEEEFLATCRVASMHQISIKNDKILVSLFELN